jgi:hypothetical protein
MQHILTHESGFSRNLTQLRRWWLPQQLLSTRRGSRRPQRSDVNLSHEHLLRIQSTVWPRVIRATLPI